MVAGRTQTYYAWFSPPAAPQTTVWYHGIYAINGCCGWRVAGPGRHEGLGDGRVPEVDRAVHSHAIRRQRVGVGAAVEQQADLWVPYTSGVVCGPLGALALPFLRLRRT